MPADSANRPTPWLRQSCPAIQIDMASSTYSTPAVRPFAWAFSRNVGRTHTSHLSLAEDRRYVQAPDLCAEAMIVANMTAVPWTYSVDEKGDSSGNVVDWSTVDGPLAGKGLW